MSAISESEIKSGLVTFLDDTILKRSKKCRCSAWLTPDKDHAIERPHYFLVLELVDNEIGWLLVPLSHNDGANRGILNEDLKTGFVDQWSENPSFYFQRQFWQIPAEVIMQASYRDHSPIGERRYYALAAPSEIAAIISWSVANRNPFRLMGDPTPSQSSISN
jgi:hypothetical protein